MLEDPASHGFFYAVRWLWAVSAQSRAAASSETRTAAVGEGRLPTHELLHFAQEPSLGFSPSTVRDIRRDEVRDRWRVSVRFFGLLGPQGPLPLHISEEAIRRRLDEKDRVLEDFFDLFNNRMTAFYYRAWAVHQMTIAADAGEGGRFDRYLGALCGLEDRRDRSRDTIPAPAKIHYAGLLALPTRPGESLANLLSDFFRASVAIEPFAGRWVPVPPESRCILGRIGTAQRLGRATVLGERVWEVRQRFRLRIGPLSLAVFKRFLPGGEAHKRLADWVRIYNGLECGCDATLVLKAKEVPSAILDGAGQLGRTLWLASRPFTRDADDALVRVVA